MSVNEVEVVERIWGESFPLHLLSCESWIFVEEKPDRKKKQKSKLYFRTCRTCNNRLSVYVIEERLESFMTEVVIIQKQVQWFAEQINGLISIRQQRPSWKTYCFATCMYWLRYISWLWQNKWHLCIQISKEHAFN